MLWPLTWPLFGLIITPTVASPDEPGSRMLHKDEVNILRELSPQLLDDSEASLTTDDRGCPVLQVGQRSTLAVPLWHFLSDGFADEFSLLVQLRSPQRGNRSVLAVLDTDDRILLQLGVSAHAIVFKGPQQQHYEVPFFGLSDGSWHHVAIGVSAKHLDLHVDCAPLKSLDWEYRGMENGTAGRLVIGGIAEGHVTPFEGHLRQLTFLMRDPEAARQQCSHHPPRCGEISTAASSLNTKSTVKVWKDGGKKRTGLHLRSLMDPNCDLFS